MCGRASVHSVMGRWIKPSCHGGPIELLLIQASAPDWITWYILSCLWDGVAHVAAAGFQGDVAQW